MKATLAGAGTVLARSFVASRDSKKTLTRIYMPSNCRLFATRRQQVPLPAKGAA